MAFYLKQVFVVDQDTLKLILSEDATVTSDLLNVANYSVTPLDSGSAVEIKYVLQPESETTDSIFLITTKPELGKKYRINVVDGSLISTSAVKIENAFAEWTHGRTKVDSALSSFQRLFDLSPNSNMRFLVQAMMISDENISGQNEYKQTPAGANVGWNSSNWSDSNWGE